MSRPSKKHDPEIARKVLNMSQFGAPQEEIAIVVGLSKGTLLKLYGRELEYGRYQARHEVRQKLFEKCMAGDTACLIFYAKTQLGWRENKNDEADKDKENIKRVAAAISAAMKSVGDE